MALVDYSDSESDSETGSVPSAPKSRPAEAARPAFQKAAPGKIKVDLPSIKPEPSRTEDSDGPPAKRARTGGAFGGFNSLLPAPKRASQSAPKAGVSLKTSSEAAFSRNPVPRHAEGNEELDTLGQDTSSADKGVDKQAAVEEPVLVGKATRFLPLSVSSKKKKKLVTKAAPSTERPSGISERQQNSTTSNEVTGIVSAGTASIPKPKKSLFSVQQEEETAHVEHNSGVYEPLLTQEGQQDLAEAVTQPVAVQVPAAALADPNSLEATVADLNLTPAQRRHLFGRQGGKGANVMHFNLDNEYAANEQLRQAGEVVEHRAVKAIAPGKHSLQQLVNNAQSQQDAMEDKWAEGRRNRGEAASKYGWSK